MGHTLLCVLALISMNALIKYGQAQVATRVNATLRADKTTIQAGGNVKLICSVDAQVSSDWRYQWFRKAADSLVEIFKRNNVRDPNRNITVTEGGNYLCRGSKGNLGVVTEDSNIITIRKTVPNGAVVTLKPSWRPIFTGETITLRCEIQGGGATQWGYEWLTSTSSKIPRSQEYKISKALVANSGNYMCKGVPRGDLYSSTEQSRPVTLTVLNQRPKARMSVNKPQIPVDDNVTLTCTVTQSSGWKYYWYRGKKDSSPLDTQDTRGRISVTKGGIYLSGLGFGVPNRAVVSLQPNWPKIYKEEKITLKCDIEDGEDTEWLYEWNTSSLFKPPKQQESFIIGYPSHNGNYMCMGRPKNEPISVTGWSDAFTFRVFDYKPQPVLTVSPSWLSPGASVTLKCEVEHPSAGWSFYWYEAVPQLSNNYDYSYELLPDSSSGTEQDSYIVHGQTHTAGYVCRAGRGDPVYYTEYSDPKFVWSGDFHPSASLTVSPDRVQHFISDSVLVSCAGNSAEWRVRGFTEKKSMLDCSFFGEMTGATCNIHRLQEGNTVLWCESGSGEFSNAVNITAQKKDMILVSPVSPVTEGDPVTLGCKLKTGRLDSTVFFYHNDKLIQNDSMTVELKISAVSKSDEGFYKCRSSGKESPQSWMAVKSPGSSSLIPIIAGLLVGIITIFLLLLLCCYTKAKDLCCSRSIQPLNTNQLSDMDQTVSQNEPRQHVYCSLLHGDASLYNSIKHPENTESGVVENDYSDITFQPMGLNKYSRSDDPEEESLYQNLQAESDTGL